MALEIELIRDLPTTEHFTLLSDHQQETPGTFFGGKPVLHLRCPQSSIRISREDLESQPVLANLRYEDTSADGQAGEDQVVIDEIDVWVSSRY